MGCVSIEMVFLVLSFITLIILVVCFDNERKTKVELQGFYPFLLVLFGCVFFYCLGSIVGLHIEIFAPAIVSNSSKDIGMAGLSIFAIGGSFLSSNIFNYLEKMNQIQSLPRYIYRFFIITDFFVWAVIFGIIISFVITIFIIESIVILISIILVLFMLVIILLIYIYRIYVLKILYVSNNDLYKKIYRDIKKDITIYTKYHKAGFFTKMIPDLINNNKLLSSEELSIINNYFDLLQSFTDNDNMKIGISILFIKYYYIFDLYFIDLCVIIKNILDSNDEIKLNNIYYEIIVSLISEIANSNVFFLEMHAYARLIGTLQSRYEVIKKIVYFNNIENSFSNTTIHLVEAMLFRSLVSIKHDNSSESNQKLVTVGLALCHVIIGEIEANFINYLFSNYSDHDRAFNEIIEYSRYIATRLIVRNGVIDLVSKYCLIVYLIAFYTLILHRRNEEAKINELGKNIYLNFIKDYTSMLSGAISEIIITLDKSLDEIDANLFNSFYLCDPFSREKEDVSFKFIAGLLVVIDVKTDEEKEEKKNQFELLIGTKMRNLTINKDNIEHAINTTINTWVYSDGMKEILNEYLENNKQ